VEPWVAARIVGGSVGTGVATVVYTGTAGSKMVMVEAFDELWSSLLTISTTR
jgi:hypothetical protein